MASAAGVFIFGRRMKKAAWVTGGFFSDVFAPWRPPLSSGGQANTRGLRTGFEERTHFAANGVQPSLVLRTLTGALFCEQPLRVGQGHSSLGQKGSALQAGIVSGDGHLGLSNQAGHGALSGPFGKGPHRTPCTRRMASAADGNAKDTTVESPGRAAVPRGTTGERAFAIGRLNAHAGASQEIPPEAVAGGNREGLQPQVECSHRDCD